ncbi:UNVERIFIED_CONTAM: hypothetical protein GTU68_038487 [Idotea baltica]|nr:hypothetical protein [Idotea baltica]
MNMPFYVAPEQIMKDRADFAQKGIARGRSLAAVEYAGGVLICAENPSRNLRKVSEIYDRIAFAGVGRYNEYDQLRIAGIRHADVKGFTYSRDDVDPQALANQYAQMLGQLVRCSPRDQDRLDGRNSVASGCYETMTVDRTVAQPLRGSVTDEDGASLVLGAKARVESAQDWLQLQPMISTPRSAEGGRLPGRWSATKANASRQRSLRSQFSTAPPPGK